MDFEKNDMSVVPTLNGKKPKRKSISRTTKTKEEKEKEKALLKEKEKQKMKEQKKYRQIKEDAIKRRKAEKKALAAKKIAEEKKAKEKAKKAKAKEKAKAKAEAEALAKKEKEKEKKAKAREKTEAEALAKKEKEKEKKAKQREALRLHNKEKEKAQRKRAKARAKARYIRMLQETNPDSLPDQLNPRYICFKIDGYSIDKDDTENVVRTEYNPNQTWYETYNQAINSIARKILKMLYNAYPDLYPQYEEDSALAKVQYYSSLQIINEAFASNLLTMNGKYFTSAKDAWGTNFPTHVTVEVAGHPYCCECSISKLIDHKVYYNRCTGCLFKERRPGMNWCTEYNEICRKVKNCAIRKHDAFL